MKCGRWVAAVIALGWVAAALAQEWRPSDAVAERPAGGLDQDDTPLAEFSRQFSAHEPIYALIGTEPPNVKFQFSFKYAIFSPDAPVVEAVPALGGVNLAYSQTTLWDTSDESAPFYDSSYRPELLWSDEYIPSLSRRGSYGLGLQFGARHESNGRDGPDSRSMNIVYVRPIVTVGDPRGFHVTVAPRLFAYVGGQSGNEDIEDYRGYGDIRATAGWRDGLQLAALGRLGDDWDRGSIQLDLTYPLNKVLGGNFDVYLDVQGFYGYGESLLDYDERTSSLRVGIAVVR